MTLIEKVTALIEKAKLWKWFDDSFIKPNQINLICKNRVSITYVPNMNLSALTDASAMFYGCTNLKIIGDLDLSNATSLNQAFCSCDNLGKIGKLKTDNCTDFGSAFYYSRKLTEIESFNTAKVTKFDYAFNYCSELVKIPELNFSNATSVRNMFYACYALEELSVTPDTIGANGDGYELNIPCPKLSSDSLFSLLNGCVAEALVAIVLDSSLYDKFEDRHWNLVEEKQINIS